jgi:C-terminal peptidase prc
MIDPHQPVGYNEPQSHPAEAFMRIKGSPIRILVFVVLFFSLMACRLLTGNPAVTPSAVPAAQSGTASPTPPLAATTAREPQATAAGQKTLLPGSTPLPAQAGTAAPYVPTYNADGVRYCAYVPGVSQPAETGTAPGSVPETDLETILTPVAYPTYTLPAPVPVDEALTERQLAVLDQLWQDVDTNYVFTDFNGVDWEAVGEKYRRLVSQGIPEAAFYPLMDAMLLELGDEHSYFLSPDQVAEEEAEMAGENDFVGIGSVSIGSVLDPGYAVVVSVFPGSPADRAGIRIHDLYLAVDGGPVYDADGYPRTLGEEGTPLTLTVQRPGEPPRTVDLVRQRITGALPIESCLVANTRIGYVYLPSFMDETIDDQVREALEMMHSSGDLEGIILDNRVNGGGLEHVAIATLRLFTRGLQGHFISRDDAGRTVRRTMQIRAQDIGGSQTLPLVVLVSQDTASYAEIFSGILDRSGRAALVGETTLGNVEILSGYTYDDGSQAWIAGETFQPAGLENGIWEQQGIIPDVNVVSVWELFSEASDPGLAAAVEILRQEQP